jgi:hypothetical protein
MTSIVPCIIEVEGADPKLPVLVVTTSFSEKSSKASTKVVVDNYQQIPDLNQKYRKIVIIQQYPASFTERANLAFQAFEASQQIRSEEDPHPEDINYQILALEVIDWLFTMDLKKIHLLGKCAGASLAQFIVQEGESIDDHVLLHRNGNTISIEKLILAVPACRTPELLLNYNLPVHCTWQRDDSQEFSWGPITEDPLHYAKIFQGIIRYSSSVFEGCEHEIPVGLFVLL